MNSLCVFCGSSPGANGLYAEAARSFGEMLAKKTSSINQRCLPSFLERKIDQEEQDAQRASHNATPDDDSFKRSYS